MKKLPLEVIILIALAIILILPASFFVEIIAHESYHAYKNKLYAEQICFDVNNPVKAYTTIQFNDEQTKLAYSQNTLDEEERKANRFGKMISSIYILVVIVIFILAFEILKGK